VSNCVFVFLAESPGWVVPTQLDGLGMDLAGQDFQPKTQKHKKTRFKIKMFSTVRKKMSKDGKQCEYCMLKHRANTHLRHLCKHREEIVAKMTPTQKEFLSRHRVPLVVINKDRVADGYKLVLCLGCQKGRDTQTLSFFHDHINNKRCTDTFDKFASLYANNVPVLETQAVDESAELRKRIQELEAELVDNKSEMKDLQEANDDYSNEVRNLKQKQIDNVNLISLLEKYRDCPKTEEELHALKIIDHEATQELKKYNESDVGNTEDSESYDNTEVVEPVAFRPATPPPKSKVVTVGNAESLRRILVSLEHIVEEWMPYKDARYEYEELVDELEPNNLGKPYDLLRDYIRDDCTREDLEAFLRSYVS